MVELQHNLDLLEGEYEPLGEMQRLIVNQAAISALQLVASLEPVGEDDELEEAVESIEEQMEERDYENIDPEDYTK